MEMKIEADYVVIGAGAMGIAFTDEILTYSDSTVAIIDKQAKPGGHWNNAYPFVRLHQPSNFYGVSSMVLGTEELDKTGWNAGLSELASGAEVCGYFDQVMNRRFLASGRVQYYPSTTYKDAQAVSEPSGCVFEVKANKAIVDGTYMKVSVPSIQPPVYEIDEGVKVIPPNDLPKAQLPSDGYVIVGAGKTAMDAVLWLLANYVDPEEITWITPRDSWLLNRATTQPGEGFRMGDHMQFIAEAYSATEVFHNLEANDYIARIDTSAEPTMYRCATVSMDELEQLRRVKNIVRKGRVKRIRKDSIELDESSLARGTDTLYVDCSADGLEHLPTVPVFSDGKITLQTLRGCQQVFSAAFIGRIETLAGRTQGQKNLLAGVIPHPDTPKDYFTNTLDHMKNMMQWNQDDDVKDWLKETRLNPGVSGSTDMDMLMQAFQNAERFAGEYN